MYLRKISKGKIIAQKLLTICRIIVRLRISRNCFRIYRSMIRLLWGCLCPGRTWSILRIMCRLFRATLLSFWCSISRRQACQNPPKRPQACTSQTTTHKSAYHYPEYSNNYRKTNAHQAPSTTAPTPAQTPTSGS